VRRRKNKLVLYFILLMISLVGFFIFLEVNLGPTIVAVAEAKTQLTATRIINEAVHHHVVGKVNYCDLMEIHKDNQDRIVLMLPNTIMINQLASETTLEIEKNFDQIKNEGFSIPLGLITGSALLADSGPSIKIGVIPVGVINVNVEDKFIDAGINQTKHCIYLDINTELKVVVPMMNSVINVSMQVPITESIIVGPVPQWYMKFSSDTANPTIIPPVKLDGNSG